MYIYRVGAVLPRLACKKEKRTKEGVSKVPCAPK